MKDSTVVVDDGLHHGVVEDGSDDRASHLSQEGHTRRELGVLAELEIYIWELDLEFTATRDWWWSDLEGGRGSGKSPSYRTG